MHTKLMSSIGVVATIVWLSALCSAQEPPEIEVGEPFPEIVLPSMADGEPMSIRRFRGERVVLHVFASW